MKIWASEGFGDFGVESRNIKINDMQRSFFVNKGL